VQKLQAVYPVVVERLLIGDTTRRVICCPQVNSCCDKEIQVKFAEQLVMR